MEICRNCEYFIPTFEHNGICIENDAYVGECESCEDWEDKNE